MNAPAFLRSRDVARLLGVGSTATFRRRRPALVRAGFPEPDPVLGLYHAGDVEAWIRARGKAQVEDRLVGAPGTNFGAL